MALGIGPHNLGAANNAVNTDVTMAGPGAAGGLLSQEKDAKSPSTDPNFGEIMKQFQAKYGAKPEKAREIKKTLGKDDFLKIMITQMKNQDPTKPFNADQMAQQMAQYASVEQLQNVNQNIQKLDNDNKTNQRMQMTGMLGKIVTVDRERFPHVEGQNESLVYALPKDAAEVKLTVISDTGETILEKDLGPQKFGEQSFSWDGAKSNTLPSKTGTYTFKIAAKDARGNPIQTNPKAKGRVIGVGFDGTEPFFLVGNAKNQQKVTMKNIIEIDEAPAQALPWANPVDLQSAGRAPNGVQARSDAEPEAPAEAPAPAGNAFFTFKKGEGSQNLDPSALTPEVQSALSRYQSAAAVNNAGNSAGNNAGNSAGNSAGSTAGAIAAQGMGTPSGKGFPSGLSEPSGDGNMN